MKTITISTENRETYSSISNFFIDYYMTQANGEFVKVYLYLVRLLSSNNTITVSAIADHFNLTENDICRAIKYWIGQDVLKLSYDGNGKLNGIVLLPLHGPSVELSSELDAVSILEKEMSPSNYAADKAEEKISKATSSRKTKEVVSTEVAATNEASPIELTAPPKPKLTQDMMDAKNKDEDFADIIVNEVETLFGKQISTRDMETLIYIYDTLDFSVDLFEFLIEYCHSLGKKNCRYMEAVAIAWYKDNIKTVADAKARTTLTSAITRAVFKALGIRNRYPTNAETSFFTTWTQDFGFDVDMVELACEKALLANPNATIPYINGVLENWHTKNISTIEDVEKADKEFAKNAASRINSMKNAKQNPNSINNFTQTKLDDQLDEMEKLFLKEVNKKND